MQGLFHYMMVYDYLILGQGISGSFLSWYLLKDGCKVLVIDENVGQTASKVASGVINPVTGKRVVRTWLAGDLLAFADVAYESFGKSVQAALITAPDILSFHSSPEARDIFNDRIAEGETYLETYVPTEELGSGFRFNYGFGKINGCRLVEVGELISKWRTMLRQHDALLEEWFDWNELQVSPDHVQYKNVTARKLICCEGVGGYDNPYFCMLPWSKNKGEALIVSIPELSRDYTYKQGISIVPWKDDLFWVGASHDWKYHDVQPSALFRRKVQEQLDYWLRLPYSIVDHIAAERPASVGQRPFVGLHPVWPAIGILNGMGSKGCSLAPYFAFELSTHLVNNGRLMPEVDVKRFSRILSR